MWQSRNVGVDVLLVDCTRMSSDRLSVLFLFGSGALTLTERQRSGVDRHLHPHWSAVPAGKQQRRVPQRTPTSLPTACAKPAQLCVAEVHSRSEHGRRPTTSSRRLFRLRQPRQPVRSASSSSHLGIGPFLAAPSHHKCCSIDVRRPRSGSPVTMVRRHQCGVHRKLCSTTQWQTFGHDFQPPRVLNIGCQQIQVTNEDIRRDWRPCLAADPSSHALQSRTPPSQHSSSTARCAVVAKRVEETAIPAGA